MGLIKAATIKSGDKRQLAAQQPDWGRPERSPSMAHHREPSEQDIQSSLIYLQDMEKKAAQKIELERQKFSQELDQTQRAMLGDVDQIRATAREQGRSEGVALGKQSYAEKMTELGRAINELTRFRQAVVLQAKHDLLELAVLVSEHLMRTELTLRPEVCLNIVTEAIARLSDRDKVTVRVGKNDAEFLKQNKERLTRALDGIKQLTVEEDASITAGGCVIETNLGYVESRIQLKLEAIKAAFDAQFAREEQGAIAQYQPLTASAVAAEALPSAPVPVQQTLSDTEEQVEDTSTDDTFDDLEAAASEPAHAAAPNTQATDSGDDLFNDADLDSLWDDDDLFK